MTKRLIVNADDFGLSEAVNHGIIKAYEAGIVTSTTLMAAMPAFDHAVALAKQHPDLHVGIHLTLTAYKPLLKTHKHIVTENGYFRKQNDIDTIDLEEAYLEFKAQIEKVLESGLSIDHLDSHHHVHTHPILKDVVERLQQEYQLPIRGGFLYDSSIEKQSILLDQFYEEGVTIDNFRKLMQSLQEDNVYDLMCHPAYVDYFLYHISSYNLKRIDELELLCSQEVKTILKEENVELTTYDQL